nr:Lipoate-protein ligase [uncultured bacterium]
MIYYIENTQTDPQYNLALEQYIFESFNDLQMQCGGLFMLWQNHNSVIVGRHQNTIAEINVDFVNAHNINVVRRLSGGGAVYHDLGNLNYTYITNANSTGVIDFAAFCRPIQNALVSFGVPAEITGRNDMTVEGKKISGNAQYIKNGKIMHHGTLLYDTDLEILSLALNASGKGIEWKGIKSVRARVANIRPYMKSDMTTEEFKNALKDYLFNELKMKEYCLSQKDKSQTEKIKEQVYSRHSWNYGYPADVHPSEEHHSFNVCKARYIEGCGKIEILLDIDKHESIRNAAFYGDFFGNEDLSKLTKILLGHLYEHNELEHILRNIDISRYFYNLDLKTFLEILF